MATYKRGILGAFSGKLGTVIGTSWKGINVMRTISKSVTNPNSSGQQEHRSKFKLLTQFISRNIRFFKIGYSAKANKMTEYNAAVKANFATAITGDFPDHKINVQKLIPSQGVLTPLADFEATSTVPHVISLSWSDNSDNIDAAGTDIINVAVFDETNGESILSIECAERITETATITLPIEWTGHTVSIYAYLVSAGSIFNKKKSSAISNFSVISGVLIS